MKLIKLFIFLFIFSFSLAVMASEYTVIVHKAVPETEITSKDLQKIFLGEKTSWPNGDQVKIAALSSGELHSMFVRDILKMTPVQFTSLWKRSVFTGSGTGTDIKFFKNEEKLKEYVASTPGAVGYISSKSLDETVKAIQVR